MQILRNVKLPKFLNIMTNARFYVIENQIGEFESSNVNVRR